LVTHAPVTSGFDELQGTLLQQIAHDHSTYEKDFDITYRKIG
jgi:hypothetical protein